jgi:hypothetical protein
VSLEDVQDEIERNGEQRRRALAADRPMSVLARLDSEMAALYEQMRAARARNSNPAVAEVPRADGRISDRASASP